MHVHVLCVMWFLVFHSLWLSSTWPADPLSHMALQITSQASVFTRTILAIAYWRFCCFAFYGSIFPFPLRVDPYWERFALFWQDPQGASFPRSFPSPLIPSQRFSLSLLLLFSLHRVCSSSIVALIMNRHSLVWDDVQEGHVSLSLTFIRPYLGCLSLLLFVHFGCLCSLCLVWSLA